MRALIHSIRSTLDFQSIRCHQKSILFKSSDSNHRNYRVPYNQMRSEEKFRISELSFSEFRLNLRPEEKKTKPDRNVSSTLKLVKTEVNDLSFYTESLY